MQGYLKSPWERRLAEASSSFAGMWSCSQSTSASTSRSGAAPACTDKWYCRAHRFTCARIRKPDDQLTAWELILSGSERSALRAEACSADLLTVTQRYLVVQTSTWRLQ